MAAADYIIVGSGINALVAAAQLGRKGHKVLVLERNDRIGGCIRTEEITEPGFIHDVMATTFVLFITSPACVRAFADADCSADAGRPARDPQHGSQGECRRLR
jgi:phytoene dehydrogenase-like protein